MKVYTKTGDKGQTALIGGKRVAKNHPRIEAYGAVDELMSHTALLMDMLTDEHDRDFLLWIIERLMTASSVLAAEGDVKKKIPQLSTTDISFPLKFQIVLFWIQFITIVNDACDKLFNIIGQFGNGLRKVVKPHQFLVV